MALLTVFPVLVFSTVAVPEVEDEATTVTLISSPGDMGREGKLTESAGYHSCQAEYCTAPPSTCHWMPVCKIESVLKPSIPTQAAPAAPLVLVTVGTLKVPTTEVNLEPDGGEANAAPAQLESYS